MSYRDRLNRARWSRDQQAAARAKSPVAVDDRAARLTLLREFAETLEGVPHMATTLAATRAEIERLS